MSVEVNVAVAGDTGVVATVALPPSLAATEVVVSMWRAITRAPPPWLIWAQPAYTTLQVAVASDVDTAEVERVLLALPRAGGLAAAATRVLEVDYGGAFGPDLDDVCAHTGLARDEVVARHAAVAYRCAFVGFAPGFPYLLGLDDALATPRLHAPRERVPAGSVGIGGAQTGVYPHAGPGGWRLIGRARAALTPGWVEPGDVVRFVAASGP